MSGFTLEQHGIHVGELLRNAPAPVLYEVALKYEKGSAIASTGALIAMSGAKTGRSPADKRIAIEAATEKIWWGPVNIKLDTHTFMINRERAIDYLNTRQFLFVVDAYAGWDPAHRIKVRVITERAYHALFMSNMLIPPTPEELADFGEPDYVIFNAGRFPANRYTTGMTSTTSVDLSLERREFVILGTEYAGEMKKGIFTVMHYLMPERGVLSMHCSATRAADGDDTSIFFGLSGTGKTTLSADPKRLLIGDDEHCWTDEGIFNIEGGCYAKVIDLSEEAEPDIWNAIRFGSVLENVVYDPHTRQVDYSDSSITENTRASYPIHFIRNAAIPCRGGHPSHVIFLTCDAFGVLPPVAELTPDQAMYHFISGYTAKVAGTEVGVTEPEATFSPCFSGPFLVWHPVRYAEMLADRIQRHGARVWLVNTGWSGGPYGVGRRMKLAYSRAIVDAIHNGALIDSDRFEDPIFGLSLPTRCPGVPSELLLPWQTWSSRAEYDAKALYLAGLFRDNFATYDEGASAALRGAGPRMAGEELQS